MIHHEFGLMLAKAAHAATAEWFMPSEIVPSVVVGQSVATACLEHLHAGTAGKRDASSV
jgi:hypothetical protein